MVQHRYDIIGINFTERNELTIAILLVHSLPRNVIQLSHVCKIKGWFMWQWMKKWLLEPLQRFVLLQAFYSGFD